MPTHLQVMIELDKRGKLPADMQPYLAEARRRGLIGADGSVAPPASEPAHGMRNPFVDLVSGGADSFAAQGASGLNEGIANTVGFPVDAVAGGVNLATRGINAVTGTQIPEISNPVGGTQSVKDAMTGMGMIKPPSQDVGKQVVRRVGEELGAVAIPGMGGIAKAAAPLKAAGGLLASTLASGTAAATAEQIAPGNPWVEIGAEIAGGLTPTALLRRAARKGAMKAAPLADELQAQKQAAYKAADALGAKYTAGGYQDLVQNVENAAVADHISPTRHPKAYSFIEDMAKRGKSGLSLTEMDQLRQEVRRDLIRSSDESERHFGGIIIDKIDDFIAKASGSQIAAGSGPEANKAILAARELNGRWRRTETIEDALYAAHLKAASTGSGGNVNNAIRQAFKSILLSDTKRQGFSAEEIKAMEAVVEGGASENVLRLVGKLSPGGNGLMTALHIALTASNPAMAGFAVGGAIAKVAADAGTIGKANALRATVAAGNSNALKVPITADQRNSMAALSAGQAANSLGDLQRPKGLRTNALN